MPSERATPAGSEAARAELALEALAPRVRAFRSAIAEAEEEIRGWADRHRGPGADRAEQVAAELGPFAAGRIDPARFASILLRDVGAGGTALAVVEEAGQVLRTLAGDPELHRVAVHPGGDLRNAVKRALDRVGWVFGVSRAVERARTGRWDSDRDAHLLTGVPFRGWNRPERALAPPLVVEVAPDDLLPAGLGEFMDGLVKIVLVVEGPTPPAPLARLVTPGTWVAQTADPADLEGLARSPHPGVALLFDRERPEQARFVHDPDAGGAPWARLALHHLPARPEVGRGRRPPTWLEELDHLEALATPPGGVVPAKAATGAEEVRPEDRFPATAAARADGGEAPVDRLAAWLLATTPLDGEGGGDAGG